MAWSLVDLEWSQCRKHVGEEIVGMAQGSFKALSRLTFSLDGKLLENLI